MRESAFGGTPVLLTGGMGMLAADVLPLLVREGARVFATDIVAGERHGVPMHHLDITDLRAVREVVRDLQPSWIINCAAYTAVDGAETDRGRAFLINSYGPANLAWAAKESHAALVHLSTDYVFGGAPAGAISPPRNTPYREDEPFAPCGVYGQSKRAGDEQVLSLLPDRSVIVRTSWLHGVYGPNFVATVLKLGEEKNRTEIRVVNDQTGSPTYSGWLASVIIKLMKLGARGVFHATSRGNITWYDFAHEIIRLAGLPVQVVPQSTAELNRPAPRPAYSTLDVSKLERTLNEPCITWQEGLVAHLRALGVLR